MLGGLVGMAAADVAFVESAQAALAALLIGWRLPAGIARRLPARRVRAQHRPAARLRPPPRAPAGRRARPGRRRGGRARAAPTTRRRSCTSPTSRATAASSSRPGRSRRCAATPALPLVLDAAQSLGHVDTDLGADVVYGTSRKWLAGPRGVGLLFVRPALAAQLTPGASRARGRAADAGIRVRRGARRRPGGPGRSRSATTSQPVPTGCASGWRRWAGRPGSCSTASAGWRVDRAGGRADRDDDADPAGRRRRPRHARPTARRARHRRQRDRRRSGRPAR